MDATDLPPVESVLLSDLGAPAAAQVYHWQYGVTRECCGRNRSRNA